VTLETQQAAINEALALIGDYEADALVGNPNPPEEYGKLIRAGEALAQMVWAMAKANGARQNQQTLRMMAQAQVVLVTLLHKAYAVGARGGREEREGV